MTRPSLKVVAPTPKPPPLSQRYAEVPREAKVAIGVAMTRATSAWRGVDGFATRVSVEKARADLIEMIDAGTEALKRLP